MFAFVLSAVAASIVFVLTGNRIGPRTFLLRYGLVRRGRLRARPFNYLTLGRPDFRFVRRRTRRSILLRRTETIHWTNELPIGTIERVQVDSSRLDVRMTEQLLDRPNVREYHYIKLFEILLDALAAEQGAATFNSFASSAASQGTISAWSAWRREVDRRDIRHTRRWRWEDRPAGCELMARHRTTEAHRRPWPNGESRDF